jgi:hypothetical protein
MGMRNPKKKACCYSFVFLGAAWAMMQCLFPPSALGEGRFRGAEKTTGIVTGKKTTEEAPPEKAPRKGLPPPADRDPTKVLPEIESQMEEAEPPEIRITGVVEVKGKKAAIAELNLEDFEGMVMLEPGMTVSIPKPNRGQSESKRWMTYFQVTEINRNGVLLIMENGERIWVPVMGEKD